MSDRSLYLDFPKEMFEGTIEEIKNRINKFIPAGSVVKMIETGDFRVKRPPNYVVGDDMEHLS